MESFQEKKPICFFSVNSQFFFVNFEFSLSAKKFFIVPATETTFVGAAVGVSDRRLAKIERGGSREVLGLKLSIWERVKNFGFK